MGASIAAHHFGSGRRDPRYPSPGFKLALFRGAAPVGASAHQGFLALQGAEIPRLFRARPEKQRRPLCRRPPDHLRRSVAISDRGGSALWVSETDEALRKKDSRSRCAALPRREAVARCRLPRLVAAYSI